MSLQLAAQHLASHGRGDDKVLVHMTRGELKSLNDLAMAGGGHLTINPHTGLHEAGFLRAMLPMIIGAGLAAATGGTSLAVSPMMAAGIVGAGYTAATGSVKKGLMAGLGAYGGAGLGSSLASSGAATGTAGVATEAPQIANANMADAYKGVGQMQNGVNPNAFGASVPPVEGMNPANYQITPQDLANQKMAEIEAASNGARSSMDGLNGAKVAQASQLSGATQNALANPMSAGFNTATGSWQGAKDFLGANKVPLIAGGVAALTNTDEKKPQEIKSDADQGQRFNYQANPTGAATGATPNPNIPSYEQMMTNPQNFGAEQRYFNPQYVNRAAGGPVEQMSNNSMMGVNTMYPMANISTSSYGTPDQMADGGFIGTTLDDAGSNFGHMFKGGGSKEGWEKLNAMIGGGAKPAEASPSKQSYSPSSQTYSSMATGGIADAGYNLGGYSDGGRLLRGPGDGVSDSIPAMIGEKQPARLADGEFVVPARIVSEIGNGSTEAGARKLYAMMDRVQSARKKTVGKDKIAHNSRADKYLPA